jgi:type I restriction enzyme M protein
MQGPVSFNNFLSSLFENFNQKSFRRTDYLAYINRRKDQRGGDEASIVDTAIVGPLLGLLGFVLGERVYNEGRQNGRPDFAPTDSTYGTSFIVEDKSTSVDLNFDITDPESHLLKL